MDTVENKQDFDKDNCIEENNKKSSSFFSKIAFFKLLDSKKSKIAEEILDDSYPKKIYWIQLSLSCMISAIWLFMNSIPVIIWAMLISPLLDPIKSLAFAITNWHKNIYIRSSRTLFLSIFVAILSSIFISFVIPFSTITSEILSRVSPTIIDLLVAFFSGIVAFLSFWFKKLQETVAWVTIAVALLPPLSIVGIWLFFLDLSILKWSFLLFFTNLVAILIVWVLVFYMFWFFPTNKRGKKRSFIRLLLVIFSILVIVFPLQSSMEQIAENFQIENELNKYAKSYFESLDQEIVLDKLTFYKSENGVLRVSMVLNVPSDIVLNNSNKEELTEILSLNTSKSVVLDIDIVEISSVFVSKYDDLFDKFKNKMNQKIFDNYTWMIVLDSKLLNQWWNFVLFLSFYSKEPLDRNLVYQDFLKDFQDLYWESSDIIIQWYDNWFYKDRNDKTKQEVELEKQFYVLFSWSKLNKLEIKNLSEVVSWVVEDYNLVDVDFDTSEYPSKIRARLKDWKIILEQYFSCKVVLNTKINYFSLFKL